MAEGISELGVIIEEKLLWPLVFTQRIIVARRMPLVSALTMLPSVIMQLLASGLPNEFLSTAI